MISISGVFEQGELVTFTQDAGAATRLGPKLQADGKI
jgi:hypothetical protein